jgi:glutaminyl-peptide cyclotransferase
VSRLALLAALLMGAAAPGIHAQDLPPTLPQFDGARALEYTRQFVATGPRWIGSPGHAKAEAFLKEQFRRDRLEEDSFTTDTPAGPMLMHNFIVRFPGKKDGVIVLASHYETNYPLRNIAYVGANDGGSTTGTLIEIANHLRGNPLDGYSVWLVFFDGEEAFKNWSASDSRLRQPPSRLKMAGRRHPEENQGIHPPRHDRRQGPRHRPRPQLHALAPRPGEAGRDQYNYQHYFFQTENTIEDDHLPFVHRGVPCADLIDFDYGPKSFMHPDGYHHTAQDTMDKISANSLTIVGTTVLETIRLLNQR